MCSYRVSLTVGHESTLRRGDAYSGETHDWRLFVCGTAGQDISHYVSKIVFDLHGSYTYPKRVLHEPPYEIRESGCGCFVVPIRVYIKHSPASIKLRYRLLLAASVGSKLFTHVFRDPAEPVRTCLLRGGARVVEPASKLNALDRRELVRRLFESEETGDSAETYAAMDPVREVLTANLDRVSAEKLKRKHHETISVDSKRRREGKSPKENLKRNISDVKPEESNAKNVKNTVKSERVRTASKASEVKVVPQEKWTEEMVIDGLKKALKLMEMTTSEIDLVSQLYIGIRKQQKSKASIKLPPFSDPIYRVPELPMT